MNRYRKSARVRKLREHLESLGHRRVVVWWETVGPAAEMCGLSGGFMFRSKQESGPTPLGLSLAEAVETASRHYDVRSS